MQSLESKHCVAQNLNAAQDSLFPFAALGKVKENFQIFLLFSFDLSIP